MNILVISFEFPPAPGGIGEYAYQTAKQLDNLGHEVLVIAAYKKPNQNDFIDFCNKQPFPIKWLKGYNGRTSFVLRSFFFFKEIYLKNKIDLIIAASPDAGLVATILKKMYSVPYLIIGHGSEFLPGSIVRNNLIKMYYNNCEYILANSSFTKNLIYKSQISNKNIEIFHPGADELLFDLTKYKASQKTEKNILLTVGSLTIRKGHRFVLEAVKNLKNQIQNFEYWIIGEGSERESIAKFISENKLKDNVKLIGFVDREELPKYFAQAKVFILNSTNTDPSQVEGFGIVLMEAHLMHLPVIGVSETGMEDAIENGVNGLLINSTDVKQIEEAVLYLFKNEPVLKRFGKNGYNKAKKGYTWNIYGEKLNKFILEKFT